MSRKPYTAEEKRVWDAAYAVAFVADFQTSHEANGWEWAAENVSAEHAGGVADMAVEALRRWRRDENAHMGKR